ncbi:50S ribosomal protein L32 [Pontibacter sp. G13]|uniref:50S ribosomal protein L32 n=1 Tax=Pontibacter sp. G13 TaxID=3074898 RepID=UPI00288B7493|nr:50S ribosomal protein L32 [Pontibacter sp. G13]WNJ21456.1 50S ribosomal protein L32 [Pontibacter sp. G13]
MAHPKRKISKTRRDKRRTHLKLAKRTYYIDPVSGEATQYHRVCLESGHYRGRQVMAAADEE